MGVELADAWPRRHHLQELLVADFPGAGSCPGSCWRSPWRQPVGLSQRCLLLASPLRAVQAAQARAWGPSLHWRGLEIQAALKKGSHPQDHALQSMALASRSRENTMGCLLHSRDCQKPMPSPRLPKQEKGSGARLSVLAPGPGRKEAGAVPGALCLHSDTH